MSHNYDFTVLPDITEASWKRKLFSPTVKKTAAGLVAWEAAFYGIEWGLDKYLDKAKDKATKEMLEKDSGTGIKEYKEPPSVSFYYVIEKRSRPTHT